MPYIHTRQHVHNRGRAPVDFLDELIDWGRSAPDDIFVPNEASDIYSSVRNVLGPWRGILHRRAVMLEVLRVLAGFESSWNWREGVDTSNPDSDTAVEIEAGIFQVSANSMNFGPELRNLVRRRAGAVDPLTFQRAMKDDHQLALEYTARLLRRTTRHHGPVRDFHIHAWLRADAVEEILELLGGESAIAVETAAVAPQKKSKKTPIPAGLPPQVKLAFEHRNRLESQCNWIFEVDYSINSRSKRLFVYSIKDNKLSEFKCAHGIGGSNGSPHNGVTREVSNVPGSLCSSLGVIRTGEHYLSEKVGQAVRLHGLSPTNSNILSRGIVLHGGSYVADNDGGTENSVSGRSEGCLVVSEKYIDRARGGDLIEWLKDGSIGVAHHGGKFQV